MRKVIPVAVLVAALFGAPAALAASPPPPSSPTVTAGATTSIGQTYATVHGTVNANTLATTYQFEYGPTNALGKAVPVTAGSVGSGTTAVSKSNRIGGLSPDTTYYWELVATNSDGTSTTPIQSFKTTGNPAPVSTTDLATNVQRNSATLVGTIAPNNQATTYFFQYGLTSSYGYQSNIASIPAGTAPTAVSIRLPGLAAGLVYHFRLVSSHGPTSTSYGADMTFQTLPWPRRHTVLALVLHRHSTGRRAARITAKGTIGLSAATAATVGCQGTVTVRYYSGSQKLATRKALVGPRCGFSASARIRYRGSGSMRIRVKASFSGNTYQAPVKRSAQVKLG
jgi:hypothetical protein